MRFAPLQELPPLTSSDWAQPWKMTQGCHHEGPPYCRHWCWVQFNLLVCWIRWQIQRLALTPTSGIRLYVSLVRSSVFWWQPDIRLVDTGGEEAGNVSGLLFPEAVNRYSTGRRGEVWGAYGERLSIVHKEVLEKRQLLSVGWRQCLWAVGELDRALLSSGYYSA